MALYEVVFSLLGILAQYIAVPVLTEMCHFRDSTLGALVWLTVSCSAIIMAFATSEWLIWVAVTVAFLELTITPSIRSNISKVVGPFEVGAVFSILTTFQAGKIISLICGCKFNLNRKQFLFLCNRTDMSSKRILPNLGCRALCR